MWLAKHKCMSWFGDVSAECAVYNLSNLLILNFCVHHSSKVDDPDLHVGKIDLKNNLIPLWPLWLHLVAPQFENHWSRMSFSLHWNSNL